VADAGNGGSDDDALEASVGPGVGGGVADAEVDTGDPDGVGVVTGAGLVAVVQAPTTRPATIVVAIRESDECIQWSPRTACGSETFGRPTCCARGLSGCRHPDNVLGRSR
jgi:hypothetical protein